MRLFRLIIFSCYYLLLTGHFAYAESENTVRVGDIITIILPGEESLNTTFQVDKQGQVTLPEIGYFNRCWENRTTNGHDYYYELKNRDAGS